VGPLWGSRARDLNRRRYRITASGRIAYPARRIDHSQALLDALDATIEAGRRLTTLAERLLTCAARGERALTGKHGRRERTYERIDRPRATPRESDLSYASSFGRCNGTNPTRDDVTFAPPIIEAADGSRDAGQPSVCPHLAAMLADKQLRGESRGVFA
jgi:hypothetical protein